LGILPTIGVNMSKDDNATLVLVITAIIGIGIGLYLYIKKAGPSPNQTPDVCPDGTAPVSGQCQNPDGGHLIWNGSAWVPHTGEGARVGLRLTLNPIGGPIPEMDIKLSGTAGDVPVEIIQTTINLKTTFTVFEGLYNLYILRRDLGNFWQLRWTGSLWSVGNAGLDLSLDVYPPEATTQLTITVGVTWGEALLSGVNMSLQRPGGSPITAVTNSSGAIIIDNIPQGVYSVVLSKDGYNNYSAIHNIAGTTQLLHLTMIEISCQPGHHYNASGVCVTCPDGSRWDGFNCIPHQCPSGSIWRDTAGSCVPIAGSGSGTLHIYVRDVQGGAIIPGAAVQLWRGVWNDQGGQGSGYYDYPSVTVTGTTGADGKYSFGSLPFGHYEIRKSKAGYYNPSNGDYITFVNSATMDVYLGVLSVDLCRPYAVTATAWSLEFYDQTSGNVYDTLEDWFRTFGLAALITFLGDLLLGNGQWGSRINQAQYDVAMTSLQNQGGSNTPTGAGSGSTTGEIIGPCGGICFDCPKRYDCINYLNSRAGGGCNCR